MVAGVAVAVAALARKGLRLGSHRSRGSCNYSCASHYCLGAQPSNRTCQRIVIVTISNCSAKSTAGLGGCCATQFWGRWRCLSKSHAIQSTMSILPGAWQLSRHTPTNCTRCDAQQGMPTGQHSRQPRGKLAEVAGVAAGVAGVAVGAAGAALLWSAMHL